MNPYRREMYSASLRGKDEDEGGIEEKEKDERRR
jgi:hypothetical protein